MARHVTNPEYTCACCGKTLTSGWSEEEALAEAKAKFGPDADPRKNPAFTTMCDDCYKIVVADTEDDHVVLAEFDQWRRKLADPDIAELGCRLMAKYKEHPHLRRGRLGGWVSPDQVVIYLDDGEFAVVIDVALLYPCDEH